MLIVCSLAWVDRGQASRKQAPKAVQQVSCDSWHVARAAFYLQCPCSACEDTVSYTHLTLPTIC
eukprot:15234118-Alexandrium_andersonii.AAC.1